MKASSSSSSQIIPGLPHDLALECLLRIPPSSLPRLQSVSPLWKIVIQGDRFHVQRRRRFHRTPSLFVARLTKRLQVELLEICLENAEYTLLFTCCREDVADKFLDGCAQASVGDSVLFVGGRRRMQDHPSGDVNVFNIVRRRWSEGAKMLRPCTNFAWGLIHNKLFVVGGDDGEGRNDSTPAEVYDFTSNCWARVASIPVALHIDIYFVLDGKFFVQGNYNAVNHTNRKAYCYDPCKNEWQENHTILGIAEGDRSNQIVATHDGTLIMAQSWDGSSLSANGVTSVEAMLIDKETAESFGLAKYTLDGNAHVCLCRAGDKALLVLPCKEREKLRLKDHPFVSFFQQVFIPCFSILGATTVINS